MAAWMLHGLCFGEEAGARNLVFFRVKWLQPAMKGTSSVRGRFCRELFLLCVLQQVVVPVCVVLCVSWSCGCWSHWHGCMNVAWAVYWSGCIQAAIVICQQIFSILALVIFVLKFLSKIASKSSFFLFGVDPSGFRATISDAVARSSIAFCNSVSADRIVMAASRLLCAAAAYVILLSCAVDDCKSYWNGCIQAATVICQQIFTFLVLLMFL